MRTDEAGNVCPATLGEYRDLCAAIGSDTCPAVVLLDQKIAESSLGREDKVIVSDAQMRALLMPMLIER